jgi:isoleucyl-tRNA synthetase
VVTGALELERAAKNIGSSLEASPMIYVSDANIFNTLFDLDLAEICITSNAMATNDAAPDGAFTLPEIPGVAVVVEKAVGTKCARSWKILPTVGEDAEYPDVSPRDAQALREWKALAEGATPAKAVEVPAAPVGLMETKAVEPEQPSSEAPEQAVSEAVPPARKVRPGKVADSAKAGNAEAPVKARKAPAAKKVVEATEPKAKKAKAKKTKKAVTKKAVTKKAKAKKAAKSKKTSSAAKGAKKAAPKKAATKKTAKKASTKKAVKKPTAPKAKMKKKKAR